nr:hypothetical protein [Tanacetum cinerariifolium]
MYLSTVTYRFVYTDFELGRVYWGANKKLSDEGSPRVILYRYDGLLMQSVAPPSPDYVPGPEHPPSPDYMPDHEHPPSPIEVPYVLEPEYPEYLVPSNAEAPLEDQPLPADASPTAVSLDYVANFDLNEDPDEDPRRIMPTILLMEGMEEEEHLAPADSSDVPVVDLIPSTRDTEAFETDELEPPMSASMEAHIVEHAAAPTPPLNVSSPPLPLPIPLTTSPTNAGAPLGYRAAGIRMRALLLLTSPRTDIPEAEMPPPKRACFITLAPGLEDEIVEAMMEIAPATLEGVKQRVTKLTTTVRQDTKEFQVRFEDAQDDRDFLRARVNTLFRYRRYHRHTVMLLDREATYAYRAWPGSKDRSAAIEAHVRTLEAHVATLIAQTSSLQTQLTTTLGRIETLEARDPKPQEDPAEASSSCVAAALTERDADRSRNFDDNIDSGTGGRQVSTVYECTYTDFLKCQPRNFKGTKRVVSLTQWKCFDMVELPVQIVPLNL